MLKVLRLFCLGLFVYCLFSGKMLPFEGLCGCTLVFFCLLTLYRLVIRIGEQPKYSKLDNGIFILITAILTFFGSNFFVLLFNAVPGVPEHDAQITWMVLLVTNIIFYLLLFRAIWQLRAIPS